MDSLAALLFALWVAAQLLAVICLTAFDSARHAIRRDESRVAGDKPAAGPAGYKPTLAADG